MDGDTPQVEWRAAAGAEIQQDGHGMVDLGVRRGALSAELLTETLDLRFAPSWDRGRAWVAARGQGAAAGLVISPWSDGAPDPAAAALGQTVGAELGAVRYLPAGLWVGGRGAATQWHFAPKDDRTDPFLLPEDRAVASADLIFGLWRSGIDGWGRAGVDLDDGGPMPHLSAELHVHPEGPVHVTADLWAGIAEGQDVATWTRLGGLNPYVVPLAGAAWAEFWVEDYLVVRGGPRVEVGDFDARLAADLARFDEGSGWGLALWGGWERGHWRVDEAVGWAPDLLRQGNAEAVSVYLRVARNWASGG